MNDEKGPAPLTTEARASRNLRTAASAAVVALVALWIYGPALHGSWLWDDEREIFQNPVLRDPGGWWRAWVAPAGMDYWPLKTTLQWLEWRLWADNVAGYHIVNLLLHVAGALLFWRVLGRLGARHGWIGGLLFAIHPVAVESVAWISEFKNTLSLVFYLLAVLAYLRHDEQRDGAFVAGVGDPGRPASVRPAPGDLGAIRGLALWLSLFWFVAAMLCKTSGAMFPMFLLVHAWWRRGRVGWRDVRAAAPFLAVSLVLGGITFWFQTHRAIGIAGTAEPLVSRVAQSGWSLLFYLFDSVAPVALAPIHVPVPGSWNGIIPWFVLAAIVAILGFNRKGWGRHALLGFGWFFLNLVLVLGVIPLAYLRVSPRADHLAYLSLLGPIGLAAAAIGAAWDRAAAASRRAVVVSGISAIVIAAGCESRLQASYYRGPLALWTHAVARVPGAWLARTNLGHVLAQNGDTAAALVQFREAARLMPDSSEVHADYGDALDRTGFHSKAQAEYREAVRLDPGFAGAHYDLGVSLLFSGREEKAATELRICLRLDPDNARAHNDLGLALARLGRLEEAMGEYAAAIRLDPDLPEAHLNRGNALFRQGRPSDAVTEYRLALRANPDYAAAHRNLAAVLESLDRTTEAAAELAAAARAAGSP